MRYYLAVISIFLPSTWLNTHIPTMAGRHDDHSRADDQGTSSIAEFRIRRKPLPPSTEGTTPVEQPADVALVMNFSTDTETGQSSSNLPDDLNRADQSPNSTAPMESTSLAPSTSREDRNLTCRADGLATGHDDSTEQAPRADTLSAASLEYLEDNHDRIHHDWLPLALRLPMLLGSLAFTILALIGLEVMDRISTAEQGLVSGSQDWHYAWTYGPTASM